MSVETFLLWIAIGAIAGFLASVVVGGGFGMVGDIILGIVGAFVGGILFRSLGWHAPFDGIAGTIAIAFIGAALLLGILRLVRSGRARRV